MNLNLKDRKDCTFDEISLGEIMLRLDPGEGRIKTARSFKAWEGGENTMSPEDFVGASV